MAIKLARADCENDHGDDWILSADLIGKIDCPICEEPLHAVSTWESEQADVQTDPDQDLGIV